MRRGALTIVIVASACLALSACSFHVAAGTGGHRVNDDVVASKAAFEKLVATTLAKSVDNGTTPDIDCGDDDVTLENGRVQHCALSVPGDSTRYDVRVEISDVQSYDDYSIDATVADEPE
ncbi:hypothetical protein ASF23_14090 [Curtobacterium sp. Leaf261]|nr:hypothetical protein ASF23_14090 [Curtobacterium sp. Leaf261]